MHWSLACCSFRYPIRNGKVEMLPHLVPQVDADGNDIAGIRAPDISVPVATNKDPITKAEQTRLRTWRYKALQRAGECSRTSV